MSPDKVTDVHNGRKSVIENQLDSQIAHICCFYNKEASFHFYNLVVIFVLFTVCFITKNFTHFWMMFLLYFLMNSSTIR